MPYDSDVFLKHLILGISWEISVLNVWYVMVDVAS